MPSFKSQIVKVPERKNDILKIFSKMARMQTRCELLMCTVILMRSVVDKRPCSKHMFNVLALKVSNVWFQSY